MNARAIVLFAFFLCICGAIGEINVTKGVRSSSFRMHNDLIDDISMWIDIEGTTFYYPITISAGGNHECFGNFASGIGYTVYVQSLGSDYYPDEVSLDFTYHAKDIWADPNSDGTIDLYVH